MTSKLTWLKIHKPSGSTMYEESLKLFTTLYNNVGFPMLASDFQICLAKPINV